MIKMAARGDKDGKPFHILVLGLSYMNLEKLKEGEPMRIKGKELGLSDVEILIFAGPTEKEMYEECKSLIGPLTKVKGVVPQ